MNVLTRHVLRDHVLIGGAAALVLFHGRPMEAALFWSANVLIDADHYLHFLWFTRAARWAPREMFRFHEHLFAQIRREDFLALEVFHTVEFVLFVAAVAWAAPVLRPIFWGGLFHIGVDFLHLLRHGVLGKRAHSIVEYAWRRRALARRATGRTPARPDASHGLSGPCRARRSSVG